MTTPDPDANWTEQEIEAQANRLPPYVEPVPGLDPDISQAPDAFEAHHLARFGALWRAAVVAGTAAAMIHAATSLLGMGEHPDGSNHNPVTEQYNREVAPIGDGPWCDMGVSVEALRSGNIDAVCGGPRRGFAYTIAHAADFKRRGLWTYGLHGITPGCVVFFSWSRGKSIGDIEHVGLVEHVYDDGTVATIECNIADRCRREHRDATYVVGYGRPPYHAQQQEDLLQTIVDLGTAKPFTVKPGERHSIAFETEYTGGDPDHEHADGYNPSVFPAGGRAPYVVRADVQLAAVAPGQRLTLEVCEYDRKDNKYSRTIVGEDFEGLADGGPLSKPLTVLVPMSDAHKYRVDLVNHSKAEARGTSAHMMVAR